MEPPKCDVPKISNMVMCGDHPSFTKTELNLKETKPDEKDLDKVEERTPVSHARLSPTASRTERACVRTSSSHVLRALEARRRAREPAPPPAAPHAPHATLVRAALGSFRWPPYLVGVWALALALTHALHALLQALHHTLPNLSKLCAYFRAWTEESWRGERELNQRVYPLALACVTAALYALYFALYALYCAALWATEPLCAESDSKQSSMDVGEATVTDYIDEIITQTNSTDKH